MKHETFWIKFSGAKKNNIGKFSDLSRVKSDGC